MATKIELPNFGDLRRRYLAGESISELAREAGIQGQLMRLKLKASGVALRSKTDSLLIGIDVSGMLEAYRTGETELSLSLRLGISRPAIRRQLLKAGITPRTQSDVMVERWSNASGEERSAMVAAAHDACRGRKHTIAERVLRAKTCERLGSHVSEAETVLKGWLEFRGLNATAQKAVHIYNLDVAIHEPPIAVEIFGGMWHGSGSHEGRFHKRVKYLLDCGWTVVIVWVERLRYPLGEACADYVAALAKELGRSPPARGKYRVIRGDGKLCSASKSYFNTRADIKRLGSPA